MSQHHPDLFQPVDTSGIFERVSFVFSEQGKQLFLLNATGVFINYIVGLLLAFFTFMSTEGNNSMSRSNNTSESPGILQPDLVNITNGTIPPLPRFTPPPSGAPIETWEVETIVWSSIIIGTFVHYLIFCFFDGATIRAVALQYAGRQPDLLSCIMRSWDMLPKLFSACFLLGCIIWTPFVVSYWILGSSSSFYFALLVILFLCYSCYVSVITYHIYPIILLEGNSSVEAWDSINRSIKLSEGHFKHIFKPLFFFHMFKVMVNVVISTIVQETNGTVGNKTGTLRFDLSFGGVGDTFLALAVATVFATMGSV